MYMCMIPGSALPKINIPNIDKMVHFTFYFTLVILMYWGWKKQISFQSLYRNTFTKIFVIACIYGFTIEIIAIDKFDFKIDKLARPKDASKQRI